MLSSIIQLPLLLGLLYLCSVLAFAQAEGDASLSTRQINPAQDQLLVSEDTQNVFKSSWDTALESVQKADEQTGQNMAPLVEQIAQNVGISFSNSPSPSATSTPTPSVTPSISPSSSATPSNSASPTPSKSQLVKNPTPSPSPSAPSQSPSPSQYTPDQADWSTFYSKPIAAENTDHSPDGIWWLKGEWVPWDGTIYDPTKMSRDEFYEAICPRFDIIRGIYEVYYDTKPFKDPKNPTKTEVDEWHRISMLHLRSLVGIDAAFEKDYCLFARALWGQQRRFTRMWDTKYPDGTCEGSTNAHCGALFFPDADDQKPYLPEGHPTCRRTAGSEGVTGAPKSNIPWSIKWVRAFCSFLKQEGYDGGHVGPFWSRTKFGWSFWDQDPSNNNNNCVFRAKWSGPRVTPPWLLPTSSKSPQASPTASSAPTMTPSVSPSVSPSVTPTPTQSGIIELIRFTPDQADWSTFNSKPIAAGNTDHSPDGVFWIDNWVAWDGTVYDPTKMSAKDFKDAICPNANYIRGIYEVYQEHQPFKDPVNPTKAEVDEWHRISMLHLRKLVGATAPLEKDHCLFARALWGEQRKHTRMWDTKYPDGNCAGSTYAHCGASFIPDADDQKPYLPDGHPPCGNPDGSEGILPQGKTNISWSIRWMRAFCTILDMEGYNGGHVGPFWGRTKFGWSFWDKDPSDNNNFFAFRVKWSGTPVNPPWV